MANKKYKINKKFLILVKIYNKIKILNMQKIIYICILLNFIFLYITYLNNNINIYKLISKTKFYKIILKIIAKILNKDIILCFPQTFLFIKLF